MKILAHKQGPINVSIYFFPSFPSIYGKENYDDGNSYFPGDRVSCSPAWPQTMQAEMTLNICPSAFTF